MYVGGVGCAHGSHVVVDVQSVVFLIAHCVLPVATATQLLLPLVMVLENNGAIKFQRLWRRRQFDRFLGSQATSVQAVLRGFLTRQLQLSTALTRTLMRQWPRRSPHALLLQIQGKYHAPTLEEVQRAAGHVRDLAGRCTAQAHWRRAVQFAGPATLPSRSINSDTSVMIIGWRTSPLVSGAVVGQLPTFSASKTPEALQDIKHNWLACCVAATPVVVKRWGPMPRRDTGYLTVSGVRNATPLSLSLV